MTGDWVQASIDPFVPVTEDRTWNYGYKWWLIDYEFAGQEYVAFAGIGFGGQMPIVLPELDLVIVFTGWNALPDRPALGTEEAIERVLESVTDP